MKEIINQAWLARKVGYSQSMMSMILKGHRSPKYSQAKKIAKIIGCDVDVVMDAKINPYKLRGAFFWFQSWKH
jgi:transcriptional regulator with XRE-family HTH domain